MRRFLLGVVAFLVLGTVVAQESDSYRIERGRLGTFDGAVELQASRYGITRSSLGEAVVGSGPASPSFSVDGGWTAGLRPALEIAGVRFVDETTLTWSPDASLGGYRVYRGAVSALPAAPAVCIAEPAHANLADGFTPSAGTVSYYLVTALDGAVAEGPVGTASDGSARALNASCP